MNCLGQFSVWLSAFSVLVFSIVAVGASHTSFGNGNRAHELLVSVSNTMAEAQTLTATMTHRYIFDRPIPGVPEEDLTGRYLFAFESPNKIAVIAEDGIASETFISDGETVHIYRRLPGESYHSGPAPEHLEHLLRGAGWRRVLKPFITKQLYGMEFERALGYLDELKYLGMEKDENDESHHIRFVVNSETILENFMDKESSGSEIIPGDEEEWREILKIDFKIEFEVWITKAEPYLLREFRVDSTEMVAAIHAFAMETEGVDVGDVRNLVDERRQAWIFTDWKVNETLSVDAFHFQRPENNEEN